MGFIDKIKQNAQKAKEEIEQGTSDAIMKEEMDPHGREHKGQPPGAPKKDK